MPGDRGPWLGGSVLWGGVATPFAYFRWQPGCRTSSAVTGTSQPPPPRAHCRRDPLCPRQHAHLLPAWAEPALRPGSRRPWHARPRGSAHSACRRRGDGAAAGVGWRDAASVREASAGSCPPSLSPQSSSETLLFRACASRLSLGGSHHPRMWLAVHGRRLASPRRPLCSHRNKMPPPERL